MTFLELSGGGLIMLLALGFLFFALSSLLSVISGAQFVETPTTLFSDIVALANLRPGQQFVELGSGAGTLCRFVAGHTKARVLGVDINPTLTIYAKLRGLKISNARFALGDVRKTDLSAADVVYVYMLPPLLRTLDSKFSAELQPGARVISYAFPLPDRKPTRMLPKAPNRGALYLYTY